MVVLKGIIPALVISYTENDSICVEDIHGLVNHMIGAGVGAIVATGRSAEVQKLERDERVLVVRTAVEAAQRRVPIIAGIEAETTKLAIQFSHDAMQAGADALLVIPPWSHYSVSRGVMGGPTFIDADGEQTARHHEAIDSAVDAPLVLYNFGPASPAGYTPRALRRLLAIENVIAIKQVSYVPNEYRAQRALVKEQRPDVAVLADDVVTLFHSLVIGADGALIGIANIATRLWVQMFDAVAQGDYSTGKRIQDQLAPILNACQPLPYFAPRQRIALHILGLLSSSRYRPPVWVGHDDERVVREALERSGLLNEAPRSGPIPIPAEAP